MYKVLAFAFLCFCLVSSQNSQYLMPHEDSLHNKTWMGFPSERYIWGRDLPKVQKDIALIAKTISKYEPVNLIVTSLAAKLNAQKLIDQVPFQSQYDINLIIHPINDLWLRDTGATFVYNLANNQVNAVDFNFNGWGNKQEHNYDQDIAKFIAKYENVKRLTTDLVLEGGALEVDGEGTAILAESCILNRNRNPGWTKKQVEDELNYLLGIKKVIWVPGLKGEEITDGHIDFYARFVGKAKPGHVLVHMDKHDPSTQENLDIISNSTDALGRKLVPIILNGPNYNKIRPSIKASVDSAIGYCNFYVLNNAVVLANFGDQDADQNARQILQNAFPDRTIEMIQVDNVVNGGGSVHCSTQQEIAN